MIGLVQAYLSGHESLTIHVEYEGETQHSSLVTEDGISIQISKTEMLQLHRAVAALRRVSPRLWTEMKLYVHADSTFVADFKPDFFLRRPR